MLSYSKSAACPVVMLILFAALSVTKMKMLLRKLSPIFWKVTVLTLPVLALRQSKKPKHSFKFFKTVATTSSVKHSGRFTWQQVSNKRDISVNPVRATPRAVISNAVCNA